jgi:hypothetical protein
MNKHLLLGAEAIALGALDAGISGVYAYPGTPSTEITEYIQKNSAALGTTGAISPGLPTKKRPMRRLSACPMPASEVWCA